MESRVTAEGGAQAPGQSGPVGQPSGRLLLRNTAWNLVGLVLPMAVGLFAIPYLLQRLGTDRFGLLTIIWMGVGYFTLFDMGFGRALTKVVAERAGRVSAGDLSGEIWTAIWIVLALGTFGAVLITLLAKPIIVSVLNVPPAIHWDGIASFRLLGLTLPFIVATSALIGILEGHQEFARIAVIRVPLGVMTFLAPVLSLQVSDSLVAATALLAVVRVIACVAYFLLAARVAAALRRPVGVNRAFIKPLFVYGGWLTVSSIIGPLMLYTDRFVIGSLVTLAAVSYYATPYEVLSRLQVISQGLLGVLFPAFALAHASDSDRLVRLYQRATEVLSLTMFPLLGLLFLFAPELLSLWLGPEFSKAAASATRWLCFGWLHVIVARTNSTILQATGRPDLLAKAHLLELAPFLAALWWSTGRFGILGAAVVWAARGVADAFILAGAVIFATPGMARVVVRNLLIFPVLWLVFATLVLVHGNYPKLAVATLLVAASGLLLLRSLQKSLFRALA